MNNSKALIKQADLKRCLSAWWAAFESEPCIEVKPDGTVQMFPADTKPDRVDDDWGDV